MKRAVVVGGGISGLATAWLLREKASAAGVELEVLLLEKEQVVGGKIRSIRNDGFLCEWGPNGFLDNKPQTLELCRRLQVSDRLLRSNDNARKRFIYAEGELHRLPENGPSFLKSRLLSWGGKARLAMEPFAGKAPAGVDETLASFARRRLGNEALARLIAPMVSGIFAGNPETMSLRSCFPRIAELEDEYGSLIVAMVKLAKKKKRDIAEGKVVSSAAGPGGILTSFRDGIQTLTDYLAEALGDGVRTGSAVSAVTAGSSVPFRVSTSSGELEADAVAIASPAYAAAQMLRGASPAFPSILSDIPYASMTVVCFGYEAQDVRHDLNGFGYLNARDAGMNTLGTLWDSSIFENRAPAGKVLFRSMMGGACFPEYINLSDGEVKSRVAADLKTIMGITAPPSFVQIYRHEKAIPQYVAGHGRKLAALEEATQGLPGLFLAGNSYRGIGLNDCVASAEATSDAMLRHLSQ